jgi:biotin synthase
MDIQKINSTIERVYKAALPDYADIEYLLALEEENELAMLFNYADSVRKAVVGDEILLRGLIEFSNYCRNTCFYCGLNKNNKKLQRYRLSDEQIMKAVKEIADAKIKTVVLQSGEDDALDAYWLKDLIQQIKANFDMAVTLSVGERSYDDYKLWKQAGADRYLLKIETTDEELYSSLHSQMSFENRLMCSRNLKELGYQNGSGCLVGLKGQTIRSLAEDIIFFREENFEMIGIGLFIPHEATPLKNEPLGNLKLALKVIAVTRIVVKDANMPATTAIGSIGDSDARLIALKAGANVLMPNFTPQPYKKLYEIYPGKRCTFEQSGLCVDCMENMAKSINRSINYSRGDICKNNAATGVTQN